MLNPLIHFYRVIGVLSIRTFHVKDLLLSEQRFSSIIDINSDTRPITDSNTNNSSMFQRRHRCRDANVAVNGALTRAIKHNSSTRPRAPCHMAADSNLVLYWNWSNPRCQRYVSSALAQLQQLNKHTTPTFYIQKKYECSVDNPLISSLVKIDSVLYGRVKAYLLCKTESFFIT